MNFHVCQSKWHGFWQQGESLCTQSYCQYVPWKQTLPGTRLSSPRQRTSRCLELLNKMHTNKTSLLRRISRMQTFGISVYCATAHPNSNLPYCLKDFLSLPPPPPSSFLLQFISFRFETFWRHRVSKAFDQQVSLANKNCPPAYSTNQESQYESSPW